MLDRERLQNPPPSNPVRRTWKALTRAGKIAPRCQVQRLMRQHGICGAKRRGKP